METKLNQLLANEDEFFRFMREKYPIHFNSNIFLRDIQYAVFTYFNLKGEKIKTPQAEELAILFTKSLEEKGKLVMLSHNTWKVNFIVEDFVKKEELRETEEVSQ